MPPSSRVRIPATVTALAPVLPGPVPGSANKLMFDVDPGALSTGCFSPALSYLEMTIAPNNGAGGTPFQALRLKGPGALSLFSTLRIASSRNNQVFEEMSGGDAAAWFDFLYRHAYTDAQRETLCRMDAGSTDYDMRGPAVDPFNPFVQIATYTVRIPLPTLSGLFRADVLNLSEIGGLSISSELTTDMRTAFEAVTTANVNAIINTPPVAVPATDYTAVPRTNIPSTAPLSANYVASFADASAPVRARVAFANAAGGGFTIVESTVTATTVTPATAFTVAANLPAVDQNNGDVGIMPLGGVVCAAYVNAGAPPPNAVVTTLNNFTAAQLLARGITVGTQVYARLSLLAAGAAPVYWPAAVAPLTTNYQACTVTAIAPNGTTPTLLDITLDRSLGAAATTYTGGVELHLFAESTSFTHASVAGDCSYQVSDPAIILAEAPAVAVAPFQYVACSAVQTPIAAGAPSPSALYPGLSFSAAFAAITKFWTGPNDRVVGTANANGTTSYNYRVYGENRVQGGDVAVTRYSPIARRETRRAIEAIPSYESRRAPGGTPRQIAVALCAKGGQPCNLSETQLEIYTNATGAAAGYMTTFLPHLRTCAVTPGGLVVTR